ncbi:hypothetical protein QRX60_43980 [Amycolatopsis mongoliensis]|uniref:Uncharacterized protein n=1 Tax=Amycolatopsis mongoliensis TaxID=715475 RepID=A0A9Y2JLX8_9PSEU|nr:hypothetical protein [Amycolatopsis sp. 4-36]WIY00935.1 hypothetical protein QRX60_43980 [Amycolatopsis sp. 4-36]
MSKRTVVAAGVLAVAGLVATSAPAWASGSATHRCDYDTSFCFTPTSTVSATGTVWGDYALWGPSGTGVIQINFHPPGDQYWYYRNVNFDANRTDGTLSMGTVPAGSEVYTVVTVQNATHAMLAGWHQD